MGLILLSLSAVSGPRTFGAGSGKGSEGRFRYSDLKEAAISGAADLWELKGLELVVVGSGAEAGVFREPLKDMLMAA